MPIDCCNGCVPPKRHLACWSTCPEYRAQREKHDAEQAAKREARKRENERIYRKTTARSRKKYPKPLR